MIRFSTMSMLYLDYVEWFNLRMFPICNEFFAKCPGLLCADLVRLLSEICLLHKSPIYESYKLDSNMIQLLWEINRLIFGALSLVYFVRNEISNVSITMPVRMNDNEYYGIVRNCQRLGDRLSSQEVRIYAFFISEVEDVISSIKNYYFY